MRKLGAISVLDTAEIQADGTVSEGVVRALAMLVVDEDAIVQGGSGLDALLSSQQGATKELMLCGCKAALDEMGSNIQEDEEALRQPILCPRARLALEYRLEKKAILQRAIELNM